MIIAIIIIIAIINELNLYYVNYLKPFVYCVRGTSAIPEDTNTYLLFLSICI